MCKRIHSNVVKSDEESGQNVDVPDTIKFKYRNKPIIKKIIEELNKKYKKYNIVIELDGDPRTKILKDGSKRYIKYSSIIW